MSERIEVKVTQSIRPTVNDELLLAGTRAEISAEALSNYPEAFAVADSPEPHPEPEEPAPPAKPLDELVDEPEVQRPAKSASITEWRKFAESLGIVTTGLAKKDIIAATQSV
ncbi:hypothetical protein [Corynebacterium camporealensis]